MREGRDYSKIIFFTICGICLFTIVFSFINISIFSGVRNVVGVVLVPIQKTINSFGQGVVHFANEKKNLKQANKEIEKLNEDITGLIEENNRLKSESYELERLRKLYELDTEYMQYEKVAARVIAKDSSEWFQVFRIDKGSRDGIKVDMNVMSGGGLLGIVTDVGLNYSTVRAIIDDNSRVTAMTQHSNVNCIVEGDISLYNEGKIRLSHINLQSTITDGDKIVTSNISSKFLPGILIGYANNVDVDTSQLSKAGELIPVANFKNLSEVLVITKTKEEYINDLRREKEEKGSIKVNALSDEENNIGKVEENNE